MTLLHKDVSGPDHVIQQGQKNNSADEHTGDHINQCIGLLRIIFTKNVDIAYQTSRMACSCGTCIIIVVWAATTIEACAPRSSVPRYLNTQYCENQSHCLCTCNMKFANDHRISADLSSLGANLATSNRWLHYAGYCLSDPIPGCYHSALCIWEDSDSQNLKNVDCDRGFK